jgi:hypothetical protein
MRVTATEKLQAAVCDPASVAVHETVVWPIGNVEPEAGVQTTDVGARPPCAVTWKDTVVPAAFVVFASTRAGQDTVNVMGLGPVVDPPHATPSAHCNSTSRASQRCLPGGAPRPARGAVSTKATIWFLP